MSDSDGQSLTLLETPTTESIQSSELGEATTIKQSPRNHLGDHNCRTFAFIGGDKPHFLFTSPEGWGRFYVTDTQIALCIEDGSKHIGNILRAKHRLKYELK